MQTNSLQLSNVITWVISIAAFGLASYSLYLQRKDRKPRLRITIETDAHLTLDHCLTEMTIHAANPTDKPITITKIEFKVEKYAPITAPLGTTMSSIPSYEKREARVVVEQLRKELGVARLGRFILTDALGNKHKSDSVWV